MQYIIEKYVIRKKLIARVQAGGYIEASKKIKGLKESDFVEVELDKPEITKTLRIDDLAEEPKPKAVRRSSPPVAEKIVIEEKKPVPIIKKEGVKK